MCRNSIQGTSKTPFSLLGRKAQRELARYRNLHVMIVDPRLLQLILILSSSTDQLLTLGGVEHGTSESRRISGKVPMMAM